MAQLQASLKAATPGSAWQPQGVEQQQGEGTPQGGSEGANESKCGSDEEEPQAAGSAPVGGAAAPPPPAVSSLTKPNSTVRRPAWDASTSFLSIRNAATLAAGQRVVAAVERATSAPFAGHPISVYVNSRASARPFSTSRRHCQGECKCWCHSCSRSAPRTLAAAAGRSTDPCGCWCFVGCPAHHPLAGAPAMPGPAADEVNCAGWRGQLRRNACQQAGCRGGPAPTAATQECKRCHERFSAGAQVPRHRCTKPHCGMDEACCTTQSAQQPRRPSSTAVGNCAFCAAAHK